MRRSFLAVPLFAAAAAACVDVPDAVRAQFAAAGAADRSNFRPGQHGSAPPNDAPPAPKAADASSGPVEVGADAGGADLSDGARVDGGTS